MYKKKYVAIVFFARSNSKRLKKKLFKKILDTDILSINFKLLKNIKYVDEKIIATSLNKEDDKIETIAKKNKIKVFRGSENNVLKRFYESCMMLDKKPDIIIRYCCENPLTSSQLIEKNIKLIVDNNADLISVLKPSNIIFGIAPIIMNFKTLNEIYLKAKNKIYKEHIENYCLDNKNNFKILYPLCAKKYFFPDTNFSIDNFNDFKRVNNIFAKLNLKFEKYNFDTIIKFFSSFKIFIDDIDLYRYCLVNYKTKYNFTKHLSESDVIFNISKKNLKIKKNKIHIKLERLSNKVIIYCIKNSKRFDLIIYKNYLFCNNIFYFKIFIETIIKKIVFWPPIDTDNLNSNYKNNKSLYNNVTKLNDYFPKKIISNKKIKLNLNISKLIILNDKNFNNFIKNRNQINETMYIFNEYFVYYQNNKIVKIKKYDFFQISNIWRSYQYTMINRGIVNI